MANNWIPKIDRKTNNTLSESILKFFFEDVLTKIENDESKLELNAWNKVNNLNSKLIIESDTEKTKIQIPTKIEFGSIYFKEYRSKSRNFIKNLRHAFAHNYIIAESQDGQNVIKIALPTRKKEGIKLACYLPFEDLEMMISILKIKNSKTSKK